MISKPLGNTGIAIFPVSLGCGNFGGVGSPLHLIGRGLGEASAMAAMDEAAALGINLFDTSASYTGGASERFIGRWLSRQPAGVRERIHIATKVGIVPSARGVTMDLTPAGIARQFAGSQERLGIGRVEFCLSHAPDPATPIEATLEGFAALIEAGSVGHIGASNVSAEQAETALLASDRLGLPRYEWIQNEFNLLRRNDERKLFALCSEHGLGYTPFSPMAGGVLSGKYERGAPPPPDSRLDVRPEEQLMTDAVFDAIDRLVAAARARGVGAGALALAWVMRHPRVTSLVAGPSRNPEHLRLAREALAVELDDDAWTQIGHWFDGLAGSS